VAIKQLVSVIIPNWNGKKFLPGCLDSLISQKYSHVEIIVVDNGSTDGSIELIEQKYPSVRSIHFSTNTGFSKAVNAGINSASGEFIALLNNDTVCDANFLSAAVDELNAHPEAGTCACKMVSYHDVSILDGASDGYRRGGLPGRIGYRERDQGQFDEPRNVLAACGGAALYRRSMLDDIGLFDEDYFAYLEDVDIGLRAQLAGYKCCYTPNAIVQHLGTGTTGSGYHPMVVRLSAQNNINTIVKDLPGYLILKFLPQIIYWQLYYLAVVTVRGGQTIAWLKGTLRALGMLPKMLSKRAQIQKHRRVSLSYFEDIIVRSEAELTRSRQRLIHQETLVQTNPIQSGLSIPKKS
jgi:GT2 family glycosyltransferase